MPLASVLLIVLCVISFEPTWIITMSGRSSFSGLVLFKIKALIKIDITAKHRQKKGYKEIFTYKKSIQKGTK